MSLVFSQQFKNYKAFVMSMERLPGLFPPQKFRALINTSEGIWQYFPYQVSYMPLALT